MLHTTKFEPAVGAEALHEGETVRIHQRLPDGLFLILGKRSKRVAAADLQPLPEPSLFERWIAERTFAGGEQLVAPITRLRADYHDWLDAQDLAATHYLGHTRFCRMLSDAGVVISRMSWREPGERMAVTRMVAPLLLKAAGK